jgi:hypothetical protein
VTRLSLADSLRCARLRLWDEERRTMVSFADLARLAAEPEPPRLAAGG